MKICVPSSNRARTASIQKIFTSCVLFVPENQLEEYGKHISNEIIPVPLSFVGITQTRNFILNYFSGQRIIMVDDDPYMTGFFMNGIRHDFKKGNFEKILIKEFQRCFDLCEGLGFKIWGCEASTTIHAYHPLHLISFKSVINGSFIGIINDGEFLFDEKYKVKEDYEIVLRHYKQKGGILKVRHFHWKSRHWNNSGGCVDYRTDEMEEEAIQMLKNQYGAMIKTGKKKNKQIIAIRWV